ncbi:MAG: PKD domain-containing protein [Bacteroidota bacterium]
MKYITVFFLLFCGCLLFAQNHDFDWMMGVRYTLLPGETNVGTTHIDFNNLPPNVYREEIDLEFTVCNTSICDESGNLLFFTNCVELFNADNQPMLNSEGFNQYPFHDIYPNGLLLIQGTVGLKPVGVQDTYYLLHQKYDFTELNGEASVFGVGLYYTEIDMQEDSGRGAVTQKGVPLIVDTLANGTVTATKHANGRDWWVLLPEYNSNVYYRTLLGPGSPELLETQTIGVPTISGLSQASFSPDGSKYVRNTLVGGLYEQDYLDIYDFDRCTGLLSNHIRFPYGNGVNSGGGVAISDDNRFVYVSHRNHVYQYDLWSTDIEGSKDTIAVYDGYLDQGFNPTAFFLAQWAPDGRIYLNTVTGTHWLHAINNPRGKGESSNLVQRSLYLPTVNPFSMPNFPNYRLGPLDGSPCDTLGLDNIPVAKFRFEQDTVYYLQVEFTDLSYYEPMEWHWDFGDNTTSQDTSPVHVFPQGGTYEVCLTVSNINGEHNFCRTLDLGTVSSGEEMPSVDINIFPNPCREGVNVIISDYLPKGARVVLYDAVGQRHKEQEVYTGWNTLKLSGLRPGMYFYEVWETGVFLKSGKLIKVE